MLFRAVNIRGRETTEPLAFVHVFKPGSRAVSWVNGGREFCRDIGIDMFRVQRCYRSGTAECLGVVVAVKDIWMPVELVPRFGKTCPAEWTCDSAAEKAREYYINAFSDKIVYQLVY